jgi:hypothetical protein
MRTEAQAIRGALESFGFTEYLHDLLHKAEVTRFILGELPKTRTYLKNHFGSFFRFVQPRRKVWTSLNRNGLF